MSSGFFFLSSATQQFIWSFAHKYVVLKVYRNTYNVITDVHCKCVARRCHKFSDFWYVTMFSNPMWDEPTKCLVQHGNKN